jgi:hypothetical protein
MGLSGIYRNGLSRPGTTVREWKVFRRGCGPIRGVTWLRAESAPKKSSLKRATSTSASLIDWPCAPKPAWRYCLNLQGHLLLDLPTICGKMYSFKKNL